MQASVRVIYLFYLVYFFSDYFWELYHIPCASAKSLIQYHFCYRGRYLPWNDGQIETYGQWFKAWGEPEFESAIKMVTESLPFSQLAYVVSYTFLNFSRFITHRTSGPSSRRLWPPTMSTWRTSTCTNTVCFFTFPSQLFIPINRLDIVSFQFLLI
jgi:hypothetical protein